VLTVPNEPSLTVLSVAAPYGSVGPDATGGAEQILHQIDRALVRARHFLEILHDRLNRRGRSGVHPKPLHVATALGDVFRCLPDEPSPNGQQARLA
jgi:hypothetical protein